MARAIEQSPLVSNFSFEGQVVRGAKKILLPKAWDETALIDWKIIWKFWRWRWDLSKDILLEKSPPNIMWAKSMQEYFENAYFIISIRNPYAFAEGYTRRKKGGFDDAARFWLRCAEKQIWNCSNLEKFEILTYEEFTQDPSLLEFRLNKLLPKFGPLPANIAVKAKTIRGIETNQITNFNQQKIDKISVQDIKVITKILASKKECLEYFNYELL